MIIIMLIICQPRHLVKLFAVIVEINEMKWKWKWNIDANKWYIDIKHRNNYLVMTFFKFSIIWSIWVNRVKQYQNALYDNTTTSIITMRSTLKAHGLHSESIFCAYSLDFL